MNANKSNTLKLPVAYWALYHGELVMYQGTHTDCWNELLRQYGQSKVCDLQSANIRIARVK